MTEPIAIVGMACRFPGAASPEAYWELLRSGTHAVREPPRGRPELRPPKWLVEQAPSSSRGGFLERLDQFEPSFFRISPREAARMDPQQRLLLEVTWEALEDAGQPVAALSGTNTGVFVGIMNADFARRHAQNLAQIDAQLGPGSSLGIASNRISFLFDLRGPSMSVDTLCSSSLVATHLACRSLLDDESTPLALAGGVNVILDRTMDVFYARAGLLSADGQCRAFDAKARGIVRGEGCGMLVLKRLSRAVADGDRVHALILGSAVNQDGRSNGLTSPSRWSQEDVLRTAYRRAGVAPSSVAYIEAHGTGTLIGDPIEAAALGAVIGEGRPLDRPCVLGSVKSNLGHLESAAGVAGLIKIVLSLARETIAPSLHFESPNPYARLAERALEVPTEPRRMPGDGERTIAGVSSFGMGGTNAHVVLASADAPRPRTVRPPPRATLVPLSAVSVSALDALQARYRDLVASERVELVDLAYTAAARRDHHDLRRAIVASTASEAAGLLEQPTTYSGKVLPGQTHRIVFVYSSDPRSVVAATQTAFWRSCGIEPAASITVTAGDLDRQRIDETLGDDSTIFIEIGPEPLVRDLLRAELEHRGAAGAAIASMVPGRDERACLLHGLAELYCLGLAIDWRHVDERDARFADLGTYPWQREHSWLELPPSPASARLSRPSIITSLPEGVLVPIWESASLPAPASRNAEWILVGDPDETSAAVATDLAQAGHRVHTIGGDLAALDAPLRNHDVTGVIVLCAGDHDTHDPASAIAHANEDLARVVRVAQALVRHGDAHERRLWIVTRGAQVLEDDTALAPIARATLWGFGRVIANEHPHLRCTLVDLSPPKRLSMCAFSDPAAENVDRLVAELLADADEREVAYRAADRFVARLVRQPLPAEPARLDLDANAAYLVTGGLGGLGLAAARRLVERGAKKLVLVGRRGAASDDARRAVGELAATGATVVVEQADVADRESVNRIVTRHRIRGVIHAAGVMTPAMLQAVDPDDIHGMLAAKVEGAFNLHEALAAQELDFFVVYSTIATLLGMPGQSIYAAGNAYLDALAMHRRTHGASALSIAWPVIEETGMAASAGARAMAQLVDRGVAGMPLGQATSTLEQLLAWKEAPATVGAVALDARKWTTFYPHTASTRLAALTDGAHAAIEATAPSKPAHSSSGALAENLRTLARPDRTTAIERWLCRVIAAVMHEADEIDATRSLLDLGIDSLTALELSTMVEEELRVEVTTESLLRGPTVRELATEISQQISRDLDGVSAPAAAPRKQVDLRAKAELDPALLFSAPPAGPPRSILLTGATGFLGAYLLAELLAQTTARIQCLVRARDASEALARIEQVFGRYGIPALDLASRVSCIPGDLVRPGLGLEAADGQELARSLDTIVHCGASVNFVFPYEALEAANVGGTVEILRLASAARARLHYVSTVGVFAGRATTEPVLETARAENVEQLPLGYMQAKWVAEELVARARARGLPTTIFRPGTISGHAVNGAFNPDDFVCVLIKGCIQLGFAPSVDATVNLVPVDYVSRALVKLALTTERPAPHYHLVSAHATAWNEIVQWIRALGYPLVELPYPQWRMLVLERAEETGNALVPLLPLFRAHETTDWLLLPPYDDSLARRDLADPSVACPPIDAALFRRYIERFVVSGYIPRPAQ